MPAPAASFTERRSSPVLLCAKSASAKIGNEAAARMGLRLEVDGFHLQDFARDAARHLRLQVLFSAELLERGERARIAGLIEFEKLAVGGDQPVSAPRAG